MFSEEEIKKILNLPNEQIEKYLDKIIAKAGTDGEKIKSKISNASKLKQMISNLSPDDMQKISQALNSNDVKKIAQVLNDETGGK